MRKFILEAVAPHEPPKLEWEAPDGDEEARAIARRALVLNEGPKCAAWLINKHRRGPKGIRVKGAIRFQKWKMQELPLWFTVAIAFLSDRAGWEVTEHYEGKNNTLRVWTVKWISRGHFRKVLLDMRSPS